MKRSIFLAIYLVGFPAIGLVVGYVFFKLMELINGPLDQAAFEISLFVWGGVGLFVGVYGTVLINRIDQLKEKYSLWKEK